MIRNRFLALCAALVGLALVIVGFSLLLKPAQYRATVKIEIEPDYGPGPVPYDPYFIETEFIEIKSDVVLSNVVQVLNLDVELGKRYAGGENLSSSETIGLLRRRINLENYPNTRLIGIQIRDENPDEAARIANAIAEAYRNYRIEVHRREMKAGIEELEERYGEEVTNIAQMEANIQRLEEDSSATNSDPRDKISQMKVKVDKEKDLHKTLGEKIEADKAVVSMPRTALVTVVEPAVSPTRPAGPNRWLGAVCLICGLLIMGCGTGSLRAIMRKQKPGNPV